MATIPREVLAAAAAHGFSARVINTWHGGLARSPRVLVPIRVDALVVREPGGTWADCRMQAPEDGTTAAGPDLLAKPFADLPEPRPAGVYLHWAVPDALAHGTVAATNADVAFPALPDRWLVVRLSSSDSLSRRAVTGWVLQTGGKDPVVTPLDSFLEPGDPDDAAGPGHPPLTALGLGDAAWAGYFDNVVNRLGFYDPLGDGVGGPLAYLVCGWHSRHADDPIGEGLASRARFEARLDQLGWQLSAADLAQAFQRASDTITSATVAGLDTREARFSPGVADAVQRLRTGPLETSRLAMFEGVADTAPRAAVDVNRRPDFGHFDAPAESWPKFTLYHGAVVGIGWPGRGIGVAPRGLVGGEVSGPPLAADVSVGIGNTLTEALAAMLAANNGSSDEARLLEAVLLGGMDDLDQPDGAARLDVLLHSTGFASLPGGSTTETILQRAPAPPVSHTPDPSRTDPGVFRGQAVPPERPDATVFAEPVTAILRADTGGKESRISSPNVGKGRLHEVLAEIAEREASTAAPQAVPAANAEPTAVPTDVKRALPRFFVPHDPVILLQGAGRSFKHGSDANHSDSGKLACRLSAHTVTSLAPRAAADLPRAGEVLGDDLLERGVENGSVPPDCDDLLRELALLDPGSADVAVRAAARGAARISTVQRVQLARAYGVEQTAWWVSRDPRRDLAPLTAISGITGTLPSPIAIAPPADPWVPLHVDWEIEEVADPRLDDWQLEEVDYDARPATLPSADAPATRVLRGRALLNGGAASTAADAVRQALEHAQRSGGSSSLSPGLRLAFFSENAQTLLRAIHSLQAGAATGEGLFDAAAPAAAADHTGDLDHLAGELDRMDVLVGALDRFNTMLRAGFTADGVAAPAPGQPVPADFAALRGGFLRIRRLRVVDCFGQVLDLLGSSEERPADMTQVVRSEPLGVAERPDLLELTPRFTAPSRLWFRFVSAADDTVEANDDVSPLCGFLLPNHLDGDLQLYAPDGTGLGVVRPEAGAGVVWEDAPGRPTTVGKSPARAVDDPHLAGIAQGLLDWGVADAAPDAPSDDTALSSLLRIVDSTLWSVDPFGHAGDEHLSLLVGHPIAVLRAKLRLEVAEPVGAALELVEGLRVPVRVGALAHWQDGLLAYFVGDDYRTLYVPDPACADFARPIGPHEGFLQQVSATTDYYDTFADDLGVVAQPGASPVDHPFVDRAGLVLIQPGQEVLLTLLVEPHGVVHATTGLLPRKDIGMRRAWVAEGLAKLAPVFRFGPVLVDPKLIRMPVATDIRGTWSWSHRVDTTTWADEPVVDSTGDPKLPPDPSKGQEGWLKLNPPQDGGGGAT